MSCFKEVNASPDAQVDLLEVYAELLRGVWGTKPPGSSWILADLTTYKIVFLSQQYTDIMWGIYVFFYLFKNMFTMTY